MRPAYTVVWTLKAARMLERLPRDTQARIVDQVESITDDPFAHVRKVEGSPYHRLRVGVSRHAPDHGLAPDHPRRPGRAAGDGKLEPLGLEMGLSPRRDP